MKVKRHSKVLGVTSDFLVIECNRQGVVRCHSCGRKSLIVIAGRNHQLSWCSHCADRLLLTTFADADGSPKTNRLKIIKWVDNGSVQLIETPRRTLIVTFRTAQHQFGVLR
jgi:hypothetical protein